jgi:hypothetical protein
LSGWADDFLALVEADPEITLARAAEGLALDYPTFASRRRSRKDVLEREAEIRARHRALRRQAAMDAAETARQGEISLEVEDDLPWHLERFLALYRETRSRIETVKRMQGEGFETTWTDVTQAMREYPNFARVFGELFDEDLVEVEDGVRAAARGGKLQAARMVLQAEMPAKYGNRVQVNVDHTHRLAPEHRTLVESIKRDHIAAPRPAKLLPEPIEEAVVVHALEAALPS